MLVKGHQKQHAAAHGLIFDVGGGLALGVVDVFAILAGEWNILWAGFG